MAAPVAVGIDGPRRAVMAVMSTSATGPALRRTSGVRSRATPVRGYPDGYAHPGW